MKIKYSNQEESIIINDNLKFHYFLLYATVIFTLINAVLFSLDSISDNQQINWIGIIWIVIGILSLAALIYGVFKKTTVEKISIQDIVGLKQKNILGQQRFTLKLRNGKLRDLIHLKKQKEIQELQKLFDQIGVKTIL